MEAFFDRGFKDLYASHDFEDIVYIFNYTSDLVLQIQTAEQDVTQYLKECVQKILENDNILAVMPGHLYYESVDERMEIIMEKLKQINDGFKRA